MPGARRICISACSAAASSTRLITQMYFPGDPLLQYDPIYQSTADAAARERLIADYDPNLSEAEWALGYALRHGAARPRRDPVRGRAEGNGRQADRDAGADRRAVFRARARPARMGRPDPPTTRKGERIVIEGRVLDGDGAPVPDALIELWQANAAGRYDHPDDTQADKKIDPNFHGYGRVATDAAGPLPHHDDQARPGARPRQRAAGAAHQRRVLRPRPAAAAPHPDLFRRRGGQRERPAALVDRGRGRSRHACWLAREAATAAALYRFDIVLQGDGETGHFCDI